MEYQIGDMVNILTLRYDKGIVRKRVIGTEYYMVSILENNRENGLLYVLHTSEIEPLKLS